VKQTNYIHTQKNFSIFKISI